MKNVLKFLFLLLVLGGCEQSEVIGGDDSNVVGLRVFVDESKATRAGADLFHTASDVGSIGLYAYVKRPNGVVEVMSENLKLNYVEGQSMWEYDDPSFAPVWDYTDGSDRYTFYGYAPYREDAEGIEFNPDAESGEFSVDYNMRENADLMIARAKSIVCPAGGVVTLGMKHMLSAVSLNTTYTSQITKVELVCSEDHSASMPIAGKATIGDSGVAEWSAFEYASGASRYEMSSESRSYMLLLPQTIRNKGDLLFSITSIVKGKVVVDENAKIPTMTLNSSGVYKFNYKEPYFDVDDNGDLVIYVDEIMEGSSAYNDFSAIDELIEKIKEAGHNTVVVKGEPKDVSDAYHVIRHIIQNGGMANYDLSGYIIPEGTTLPYDLFRKNGTLMNITLPVMDNGELLGSSFTECTALESVTFPEGQTFETLPYATFKGCTSLKTVNLDMTSNSLEVLGQDVFRGCTSLEKMELPGSVSHIGYGAFMECSSLSEINIPSAVTNIEGDAFLRCVSLYSYGESRGIVFDERSGSDPAITVGWHGFYHTHVRYEDITDGYINSKTSNGGYFAEP